MKKKFFVVFLLLFSFTLVGCSKKEEDNKMYYDLKKLAPYLYEVTFDDYRYDNNSEIINDIGEFACSSVKNGNYFGRNFDFIFNDVPEFVVHMNKSKDRHASLGVAQLFGISEESFNIDEYSKMLELLPNVTLDGINDQGVIASINVVSKEDTGELIGTNPDGEDLNQRYAVQYILDYANSADHAIELLKSRNINGSIGEEYNLHIMIADKDKTYIVEFLDNNLVVEEKTGNEQIMTNFYTNLDYYTDHSAGIERYNILKENYDEGSTFEGMWNLLQRVKYSRNYLFDKEVEWYSEFLTQTQLKEITDMSVVNELYDNVKKDYWVARTYDQRNPADFNYWLTVHNSTYDIGEKKLRVTVQENYNKYFEFTLK